MKGTHPTPTKVSQSQLVVVVVVVVHNHSWLCSLAFSTTSTFASCKFSPQSTAPVSQSPGLADATKD